MTDQDLTLAAMEAHRWEIVRLRGKKPIGARWQITKDAGEVARWIAAGDNVPIIHIYAGGPALVDGRTPYGTGSVDHVSLTIKGWDECLERVKRLGYDWRASIVPGTTLWQIFVHDPSGVMMELTFDGKVEQRPTPEIPADREYIAGKPFGTPKQKAA
jgi:hypothetical protein